MKSTLLLTLLSVSLACATINAYADHHEGKMSDDGKHEMNADANNDGKVSFDEFKAAREKNMEAHFKHVDTNNDGFIDDTEKKAAKANWKKHHKEMGDKCKMHD
jgi:hypothetical protein